MSFIEAALSNALVVTIPAVLAIFLTRLRYRPAFVRALWLLVFIKLVTPPLSPLPCGELVRAMDPPPLLVDAMDSRSETSDVDGDAPLIDTGQLTLAADVDSPSNHESAAATAPTALPHVGMRAETLPTMRWTPLAWMQIGCGIWIGGSVIYLCWTAIGIFRFWKLFRLATRAPADVQRKVEHLAAEIGLSRTPQVRVLPGVATPMIWAPWRTYLLIPRDLLSQISGRSTGCPARARARAPSQSRPLGASHRDSHWRCLLVVPGSLARQAPHP